MLDRLLQGHDLLNVFYRKRCQHTLLTPWRLIDSGYYRNDGVLKPALYYGLNKINSYPPQKKPSALNNCRGRWKGRSVSWVTLFLLAADGATQHQLHQTTQLRHVPHLSNESDIRNMLVCYLLPQHLTEAEKRCTMIVTNGVTEMLASQSLYSHRGNIPACSVGSSSGYWPKTYTRVYTGNSAAWLTRLRKHRHAPSGRPVRRIRESKYLDPPVVPALLLYPSQPRLVKPGRVSGEEEEERTWRTRFRSCDQVLQKTLINLEPWTFSLHALTSCATCEPRPLRWRGRVCSYTKAPETSAAVREKKQALHMLTQTGHVFHRDAARPPRAKLLADTFKTLDVF